MLISEGIYLSEKLGREVTAEEIKENSISTSQTIQQVLDPGAVH
jgi:hypothetical protein